MRPGKSAKDICLKSGNTIVPKFGLIVVTIKMKKV